MLTSWHLQRETKHDAWHGLLGVCFVYFWGAFVAMYAGYDKCVMMDVMKRCKDGLGIL